MYNDELKNGFIEECIASEQTKNTVVNLFNRIGKYEEEIGKDLCFMNQDEASRALSKPVGGAATKRSAMSYVRGYLRWCAENVDGAVDYSSDVVLDRTETVKQKTVVNPMHMKKYLDTVFGLDDLETNDSVYKCYLWMAYSGCPEDMIFGATKANVDFHTMVFRFGTNEYPMYTESLQCVKNCVELDYFVYQHPSYSKDIIRPRVEGINILRGVRSEQNLKSFRVTVSKKVAKAIDAGLTDIKMSYKRALQSGMFFRVYQLEQFGDAPSFKDIADSFIEGREYNLTSCRNTRNSVRDKIARYFKKDYLEWKTSYNL